MQKYFHDVKRFVESHYPDLKGNIIGDVYPPPAYAVWLASICSYLWLFGILIIFAGSAICKSCNIQEPPALIWINNNRVQTFMMLFLLNNVASSMLATGAFEIYLNGNLIFSKLLTKRFPSPQDLMHGLSENGLTSQIL